MQERYSQCIYCLAQMGHTKDHLPPKLLLRKPYPANLWTVPSCKSCNNSFSRDEEYFRNMVIGLFCHSHEADTLFDGPISRSFDRRSHLEDLMFDSLGVHNGRPVVNLDNTRFQRVFEKIVRGLNFVEFNAPLPYRLDCKVFFDDVELNDIDIPELKEAPFNNKFNPDFTFRHCEYEKGSLWQLIFYQSFQGIIRVCLSKN